MQSANLKSLFFFVAATSAAALVIQACGGSSAVAQAASDADPIEGVWESAVSIRDCASGNVVRTFKGIGHFGRGGALIASNNVPPTTQGLAFGTWKRTATAGSYTASLRFYRFNPDGSVAGAQKVTRTLTMAPDASSITETISAQVLDNADSVLQNVCGTATSARVF